MLAEKFAERKIGEYLDVLGSKEPTPGGGSAAGLAGALGAALAAMAASFTVGRKRFAAVESEVRAALERLTRLRAGLLEAGRKDELAYAGLNAAFALPKEPPGPRAAVVRAALLEASAPPAEIAALALEALAVCRQLAAAANPRLLSDVGAAAELLAGTVRAAGYSIETNARALGDDPAAALMRAAQAEREKEVARMLPEALAKVREKMK